MICNILVAAVGFYHILWIILYCNLFIYWYIFNILVVAAVGFYHILWIILYFNLVIDRSIEYFWTLTNYMNLNCGSSGIFITFCQSSCILIYLLTDLFNILVAAVGFYHILRIILYFNLLISLQCFDGSSGNLSHSAIHPVISTYLLIDVFNIYRSYEILF